MLMMEIIKKLENTKEILSLIENLDSSKSFFYLFRDLCKIKCKNPKANLLVKESRISDVTKFIADNNLDIFETDKLFENIVNRDEFVIPITRLDLDIIMKVISKFKGEVHLTIIKTVYDNKIGYVKDIFSDSYYTEYTWIDHIVCYKDYDIIRYISDINYIKLICDVVIDILNIMETDIGKLSDETIVAFLKTGNEQLKEHIIKKLRNSKDKYIRIVRKMLRGD